MDPLTFANSFQAYFAPYSDSYNAVRMSKYMLNKFESLKMGCLHLSNSKKR
jgi:hypothetical protein